MSPAHPPTRSSVQKLVVGLVGGIGSGKSLVAAAMAEYCGRVISGDVLGHEALRQKEIRRQIVAQWGDRALDPKGEIDRRRLGDIVFSATEERKKLEAIVHPYIKRRLSEEIAAAQKDPKIALILVDAAVMMEAGWSGACDRIIYIDAPRELRLKRLAEQRRWSAAELAAREAAQMPLEEKRARADAVIDNSGAVADVREQVERLLRSWRILMSGLTLTPINE